MNYRKFDGHQITPGVITKVQSITRTAVNKDKPKVSFKLYTSDLHLSRLRYPRNADSAVTGIAKISNESLIVLRKLKFKALRVYTILNFVTSH